MGITKEEYYSKSARNGLIPTQPHKDASTYVKLQTFDREQSDFDGYFAFTHKDSTTNTANEDFLTESKSVATDEYNIGPITPLSNDSESMQLVENICSNDNVQKLNLSTGSSDTMTESGSESGSPTRRPVWCGGKRNRLSRNKGPTASRGRLNLHYDLLLALRTEVTHLTKHLLATRNRRSSTDICTAVFVDLDAISDVVQGFLDYKSNTSLMTKSMLETDNPHSDVKLQPSNKKKRKRTSASANEIGNFRQFRKNRKEVTKLATRSKKISSGPNKSPKLKIRSKTMKLEPLVADTIEVEICQHTTLIPPAYSETAANFTTYVPNNLHPLDLECIPCSVSEESTFFCDQDQNQQYWHVYEMRNYKRVMPPNRSGGQNTREGCRQHIVDTTLDSFVIPCSELGSCSQDCIKATSAQIREIEPLTTQSDITVDLIDSNLSDRASLVSDTMGRIGNCNSTDHLDDLSEEAKTMLLKKRKCSFYSPKPVKSREICGLSVQSDVEDYSNRFLPRPSEQSSNHEWEDESPSSFSNLSNMPPSSESITNDNSDDTSSPSSEENSTEYTIEQKRASMHFRGMRDVIHNSSNRDVKTEIRSSPTVNYPSISSSNLCNKDSLIQIAGLNKTTKQQHQKHQTMSSSLSIGSRKRKYTEDKFESRLRETKYVYQDMDKCGSTNYMDFLNRFMKSINLNQDSEKEILIETYIPITVLPTENLEQSNREEKKPKKATRSNVSKKNVRPRTKHEASGNNPKQQDTNPPQTFTGLRPIGKTKKFETSSKKTPMPLPDNKVRNPEYHRPSGYYSKPNEKASQKPNSNAVYAADKSKKVTKPQNKKSERLAPNLKKGNDSSPASLKHSCNHKKDKKQTSAAHDNAYQHPPIKHYRIETSNALNPLRNTTKQDEIPRTSKKSSGKQSRDLSSTIKNPPKKVINFDGDTETKIIHRTKRQSDKTQKLRKSCKKNKISKNAKLTVASSLSNVSMENTSVLSAVSGGELKCNISKKECYHGIKKKRVSLSKRKKYILSRGRKTRSQADTTPRRSKLRQNHVKTNSRNLKRTCKASLKTRKKNSRNIMKPRRRIARTRSLDFITEAEELISAMSALESYAQQRDYAYAFSDSTEYIHQYRPGFGEIDFVTNPDESWDDLTTDDECHIQ